MPKQTQPSDPFIFVDNPGRQETKEDRKKIRSRAARHSHEVGRRSYKAERSARSARLSEIPGISPVSRHATQASDERSPSPQELALIRRPDFHTQQYDQESSIRLPLHDGMSFPVPEQAFYRSTITFSEFFPTTADLVLNVMQCGTGCSMPGIHLR